MRPVPDFVAESATRMAEMSIIRMERALVRSGNRYGLRGPKACGDARLAGEAGEDEQR